MTPIYGAHLVSFERFSWLALVVFDLSGAFCPFFVGQEELGGSQAGSAGRGSRVKWIHQPLVRRFQGFARGFHHLII